VSVKVTATNAFGTSEPSTPNTTGARIETVPLKPSTMPSRGSFTSQTQINLLISQLTGLDTGGSSITSYVIYWD